MTKLELVDQLKEMGILEEGNRVHASNLDKAVDIIAAWSSWPKGWNKETAKKFWDSITEGRVHKRTKCIEKLKGSEIDNPGAFCQSLYMMFEKE